MDTGGAEILIYSSPPPPYLCVDSRVDTRWEGLFPTEKVEFKPEIYKKNLVTHGDLG